MGSRRVKEIEMSVQERLRRCRILEAMEKQPDFAKEIGLSDASHFRDEKDEISGRLYDVKRERANV